ncbi:DUF29 domain-containing protein [Duganella sp. BJB488]|nr:DUF29 domain-containing protein [Duganella sp. BJB489]RFP21137.1 DUF29 domain-containing protein [Duganella sp. BJB488]RFP33275.1 DUF29 domain-containing protein [Duganella sp. BJB480]
MIMAAPHENDFAEWTREQAFWLRSGDLALLDAQHLAEEVDHMAWNCRHELAMRCVGLQAHLARWQRQSGYRCGLWRKLIDLQRTRILRMLNRMPSLRKTLVETDFVQDVWIDALMRVVGEDQCYDLPDTSPWTLEQALAPDFWPD